MRITWLVEQADQIWGGVKVALEDANALADRGHEVAVVSRSGPPGWLDLRCRFERVPDFRAEHLPPADAVISTGWTTIPAAAAAGRERGAPVHFCQGYEGAFPEYRSQRAAIEAAYRLPQLAVLTIARNIHDQLRAIGVRARLIPYAIDHGVHFPGPERAPGRPLRVGLVGPAQVAWKDLRTGLDACALAARAGLQLHLVRVTNTAPDAGELDLPFPVEWHQQVPPHAMGAIYRSLDVFLGTSSGAEEGFFLPAIEAMACGVPSVLTDIPCFRAHGDPTCAMFVPPRDPAAMAEALVLVGHMAGVRQALRSNGLRLAARYTPSRHVEALEAALASCIGGDQTERAAVAASRGRMLHASGRHAEAAAAFGAAVAIEPDNPETWNDLGVAQFAEGDADAARASLEHALALDPQHPDALANLRAVSAMPDR